MPDAEAVGAAPARSPSPAPAPKAGRRWAQALAAGAGAGAFLPGAGAALFGLAATVAAALRLAPWRPGAGRDALRGQRWLVLLAALLIWLALSAAWSPAPAAEAALHWARYAVLALVAVLAAGVVPAAAVQGWAAFVAAAAALAALQLLGLGDRVPPGSVFGTLFHYGGNKSIANASLSALAAGAAVHLALTGPWRRRVRLALALAAGLIVMALLLGSASRSALVLLAVVGGLLALLHVRSMGALALAVAVAAALGGFALQGPSGLALRQAAGQLQESNRQRLALYEGTLAMVRERPLAGHGVGSWQPRWQARNADPALAEMNTAHHDWLQTAQQGGLPALALLAAVYAAWLKRGWQAQRVAPRDPAGGLVLLAAGGWVVLAGLNAAIRDAAFAAPLILLTGLALAAVRPSPAPAGWPGAAPAE